MTRLPKFIKNAEVTNQSEIEKTRLLAYFYYRELGQSHFSVKNVADWFSSLNLSVPNQSRLKQNISKSSFFIRGGKDTYKLHAREIEALDKLHPYMVMSEEILTLDTILPISLYEVNRTYIKLIAIQINSAYENNIFDGCAVLMRRLVEILLILAFDKHNILSEIKGINDNYLPFEKIVDNAKSNATLNLSRDTKTGIDKFRTLGNFSAHKIEYNCRKSYIAQEIPIFRVIVEELLYKSGLKT